MIYIFSNDSKFINIDLKNIYEIKYEISVIRVQIKLEIYKEFKILSFY